MDSWENVVTIIIIVIFSVIFSPYSNGQWGHDRKDEETEYRNRHTENVLPSLESTVDLLHKGQSPCGTCSVPLTHQRTPDSEFDVDMQFICTKNITEMK